MIVAQRWLLQLLCLSLVSFSAFADGKVFARAVAISVATPDQRAALYFSNSVERLVIETSFIGEGTNFAWVIPLPSAPKIEGVSTNFFRYLNMAFQPKLILGNSDWWILFLVIGYLLTASVWSYRNRKPGLGRVATWFGFLLLLLPLVLIMIPNFVKARGAASVASVNSVTVLNRETVGIYDTTTLKSSDGQALLDWLNEHGLHTPAAALPVISAYSKQGWVFVAATISRNTGSKENNRPHPLAFTFRAEKPVYPLRLTGVENSECSLELFVFGPDRAEAAGFRAEYCGKPFSIEVTPAEDFTSRQELFAPPEAGKYQIGNPEVVQSLMPASVATKLVATLTSKEMQTDVAVQWIPFQQTLPTFYARTAAAGAALNWIVGIGVFGLLVLYLVSPRLERTAQRRTAAVVLLLAAACGFARYSTTETTEVVFTRGGWHAAVNSFRQLDSAVQIYSLERKKTGALTDDELLQALNENIKYGAKNTFVDEPLRCEPTPGNITTRVFTNGVDVFWHDIQNVPRWLATFPSK